MKKRIWFNRWFSTVYHYIKMIKENPDQIEFEIYGTHPNPKSVYFLLCDHSEQEPVLNVDDYIQYCLEYCRKNKIDIFIPQFRLTEIMKHEKEFNNIGTQLLGPPSYLVEQISDKGKLFKRCEKDAFAPLPAYEVVNNVHDFVNAYQNIKKLGYQVCFKPCNGIGGAGFRILTEERVTLEGLIGYVSNQISIHDVTDILAGHETFDDLMVMEYLSGNEYSIDCLAYDGELLAAVPRKKEFGRIRMLEGKQELLEIAKKVNDTFKIPYIYNIQIRYNQGSPKLLEINPRMSGGLHISCFSGINFPYLALKLLLTGKAEVPKPIFDIEATHIEYPLEFNRKIDL
ncbi:ATP-grasp domain-containing protein [Bacillus sp. Marseille-P3661]|uniref:ATP-grasp domain-containing protein n=1 Tax=Bacillus sp. Marseille-P3661 TaxID=1936234 RepID=UPI000C81DF9B|nr:ATP-grasp domain-containing protein [Bacillus sp. Marseille-P3661]